jgi:hypothetical protein
MGIDSNRATGPENRREARATPRLRADIELLLRVPGQGDIAVDTVRNVSVNGANVLVRQRLAMGTSASVILAAPGVRLEFLSEVAWCRPADEAGAQTGGESAMGLHALGLQIRGPGSFAAMLAAHELARP